MLIDNRLLKDKAVGDSPKLFFIGEFASFYFIHAK
jgi:hypothetical protein